VEQAERLKTVTASEAAERLDYYAGKPVHSHSAKTQQDPQSLSRARCECAANDPPERNEEFVGDDPAAAEFPHVQRETRYSDGSEHHV